MQFAFVFRTVILINYKTAHAYKGENRTQDKPPTPVERRLYPDLNVSRIHFLIAILVSALHLKQVPAGTLVRNFQLITLCERKPVCTTQLIIQFRLIQKILIHRPETKNSKQIIVLQLHMVRGAYYSSV